MARKKRERRSLGRRSPARVLGIALIVAVVAGLLYAWQRWGDVAKARVDRRLTLENLRISPQPEWLRANVRRDAFLGGSLGELYVSEPDLSKNVHRAFELQAWVAKVERVHKTPAGQVDVRLRFRRPIAWVEVPAEMWERDEVGILPIDADAVILDANDIAPEMASGGIRIALDNLSYWGMAGTLWRDARLVGAARLAARLEDSWQELRLYRIRLAGSAASDGAPQYEIEARSGQRLVWGSAPGDEAPNEASFERKLQQLRRIAQDAGSSQPDRPVDLRLAGHEADPRQWNGGSH